MRDYLRQFTLTFYAPIREKLKREGLTALKEHFEKIYAIEGARSKLVDLKTK